MRDYTKAAKRRNKKTGKRAMFARQQAIEDIQVQTIERDDPQKTVREARARQTGRPEDIVTAPIFGEDAGRAIDAGARNRDEAAEMWRVFRAFDQAHRASVFHSTGRPMFPAVSKMEYMPERFEVRADFTPDLRSDQEHHDAAMRAWDYWRHVTGHLTPRERYSVTAASWQSDELHRDGGLTVHGVTFVAAMRAMCAVVDTLESRR